MKYILIIILLSLILSCTRNSQFEELVKQQQNMVESIYSADLVKCENEFIINGEKYTALYTDIKMLDGKFKLLKENIEDENSSGNSLEFYINQYFKFVNNLNLIENCLIDIESQKKFLQSSVRDIKELQDSNRQFLINNLVLFQSYLVNALIERSKSKEYFFTQIYPVIIEESNEVKKGDVYTAKIIMAGVDSTRLPYIEVNGVNVNYEKGEAILKIATKTKGTKKWTGQVKWLKERTGELLVFPIEDEFIVK